MPIDLNLADALNTFVMESRELLDAMEVALLKVEQTPHDADLINAIFRTAHTIKGSAGLFGLDPVVSFTHHAENVLDKVRAGQLTLAQDLVALFFEVCDHMRTLINHVAAGSQPGPDIEARSQALIIRLQQAIGPQVPDAPAQAEAMPDAEPAGAAPQAEAGVASECWHLSLRFGQDVLKNGLEPLAFIRYLTTFGRIANLLTLTHAIPAASVMDPQACYLGFELDFHTDADLATIESAFEFIRDDASIRIVPPHASLEAYQQLLAQMASDTPQPEQVLLRCGALTTDELHAIALCCASCTPVQQEACAEQALPPEETDEPEDAPHEAGPSRQAVFQDTQTLNNELIRVNAGKLDEHISLIGELIIAAAGISLAAEKSSQPELVEAASLMNRLVENIRDSALQLRMVQIGATFNKFRRVVRDVAREIGKDIRLEISGAETELDKTVVEKISDPLTHLVRNAMDHGIEPADVRLAQGKPAQGCLRLNAYHDSGSIVIEVSDDGGGLNKARILAKGVERGLVKSEQALSDYDIYQLIFEPGFSTAEQVNNLSGRGVGMDVVRRNITDLRGSVDIDSEEGVGTTMRIRLPLTLAIIDGFLVGVAGGAFVLPLDMVVECVELSAADIQSSQGRDLLNLRGEVLPFIRLQQLFNLTPPPAPAASDRLAECNDAMEAAELLTLDEELLALLHPTPRENVVVVNYAGRRAGLVVDTLMGEHQTVIRPLGVMFEGIEGISGFTILGNGHVALILDIPGLIHRVAARAPTRPVALES